METKLIEMSTKIDNLEIEIEEMKQMNNKNINKDRIISIHNAESNVDTRAKESKREEDIWICCDKCGYRCKKEVTLRKHTNTKHVVHSCKQCNVTCKTTIDLLKHLASEHVEEQSDSDNIQDEEIQETDQIKEVTIYE